MIVITGTMAAGVAVAGSAVATLINRVVTQRAVARLADEMSAAIKTQHEQLGEVRARQQEQKAELNMLAASVAQTMTTLKDELTSRFDRLMVLAEQKTERGAPSGGRRRKLHAESEDEAPAPPDLAGVAANGDDH